MSRALSPCPMIGKEHRSITPKRPTMEILTPRKVTIRRQLVVPPSYSDNDLSLVMHDARVTPKSLLSCQTRLRRVHRPTLCQGSGLEYGVARY
jgi:hypothetical protein